MKKSFKTLLNNFPIPKRSRAKKSLSKYEYRANLFISDFSSQIIDRLNQKGLKASDLADKLGVTKSAVSQMLNTQQNMSIKKMFEISDAIGLTPDFQQLIETQDCLNLNKSEVTVLKSSYSSTHKYFTVHHNIQSFNSTVSQEKTNGKVIDSKSIAVGQG